MRISDWSSDVCSSDLLCRAADRIEIGHRLAGKPPIASQPGGIGARSRIVGAEQSRIAEAVVHQPQEEGGGEDIVARIVGISAQSEARAHVGDRKSTRLNSSH